MRKIVASLLLIPLLLLVGVGYYNSSKAEAAYRAQLAQLNRNYPQLLQLQLVDYQPGLLRSQAQLTLQLPNQPPLALTQQLRQLPWGLTITTRLADDSPLARQLAKQLALADLQLVSEIALSGASKTSFALPVADVALAEGQLALKDLRISCQLDGQLSNAVLSLQLGQLELRDQQSRILLTELNFNSQLTENQGLLLGDGELTLARFSGNTAAAPAFDLKGLGYQVATRRDGEKVATVLQLSVTELALLQEKFTAAELKLTLAGLEAGTLRNLQQSAKQLQTDLLAGPVEPFLLQLQLFSLAAQLLQDGLSLTLERLELQAETGSLHGRGDVSLIGAGPLSFDRLKADLLLELDAGAFAALYRLFDSRQRQGQPAENRAVLTEQAEQLAAALIQKGLLSGSAAAGYRSELKIAAGHAALNGSPFKL